jgi:phosphatidylglycerophosphatase A
MSEPAPSPPTTTTSSAAPAQRSALRKPRVSLALATAFGLGYLPVAPGTFGSLGGTVLAIIPQWLVLLGAFWLGGVGVSLSYPGDPFVFFQCWLTIGVAVVGLLTAHRSAQYWALKDPQRVVIDEVSGQQLALLLGGFWPLRVSPAANQFSQMNLSRRFLWASHPLGVLAGSGSNWKYLLLGFILFRVFDIWKPFPARQAESLPGGLGIMADDWIAGVYAALGLWLARALGL